MVYLDSRELALRLRLRFDTALKRAGQEDPHAVLEVSSQPLQAVALYCCWAVWPPQPALAGLCSLVVCMQLCWSGLASSLLGRLCA